MRTGIIGLPGVGKTSLFKILTRAHLDAKAARDSMHVGIARVPDRRLEQLAPLYKPRKITYATIEYVDVAGLAISRRLDRLEKDIKKKRDPVLEKEQAVLLRCRAALEAETALRGLDLTAEEQKIIGGYMFLSRKPMLCVVNLGDAEAPQISSVVEKHNLAAMAAKPRTTVVPICGKIESELAELDEAEAAEMMSGYGLAESGRDRLIHATYQLLGLISFLTAGEPEARAWTIPQGFTALQAAGAIHTDIERGFIKAEVVFWEHLIAAGSVAAARERGQVRLEGKEYVVRDGDVILFRHSG